MAKILLVEDNDAYQKAAIEVLNARGHEFVLATDYVTAKSALSSEKVKGALIDCFFPYKTDSKDLSLGRETIEKLAQADKAEMRAREAMVKAAEFLDFNDTEVKSAFRKWAYNEYGVVDKSPIYRVLEEIGRLDKTVATEIFKENLSLFSNPMSKDYFPALERAIQASEANQPLGIVVAQEVSDLGVACELVTSTFHHDEITQPIKNYASLMGWELSDCAPGQEEEKGASPFWEKALTNLESRMV